MLATATSSHDLHPPELSDRGLNASNFNPMALLPIFAKDQQVCMVTRAAAPAIQQYLAQTAHHIAPGVRITVDTTQVMSNQLHRQIGLPEGKGKQALLTDMAQLAAVYADLLGCPHIGLRLEVTSQAMCPKFHIDRTGIRLLCTYLGPGTEWLDTDTHRRALPVIMQAPAFALVLLKGSAWQGNQHAGVMHRSPEVPHGEQRVLLALDALW
ncbi:DUF1826 domain-containing protein [Methylophilus sp. 5]|uniref:DUF1826 domain-containing protein n=1 Tax=Methylophilus sp. 5 TaxID=1112274 RepID=UPI0004B0EF16|nr:DUF1826 domain-containing protein [Methylophilus sp. 5]